MCSYLQFGDICRIGVHIWVDLLRGQIQVLLEVETHHLVLLPAVAEGADDLAIDLTAVQVRGVHQKDAICRHVRSGQVGAALVSSVREA